LTIRPQTRKGTMQMTALAFLGQNSSGNAFAAREYAGLLRWNKLGTVP